MQPTAKSSEAVRAAFPDGLASQQPCPGVLRRERLARGGGHRLPGEDAPRYLESAVDTVSVSERVALPAPSVTRSATW